MRRQVQHRLVRGCKARAYIAQRYPCECIVVVHTVALIERFDRASLHTTPSTRTTLPPEVCGCRIDNMASAPLLDDNELQKIYVWVDSVPLTRPKRNIARDFSDGGVYLRAVDSHWRLGVGIPFWLADELYTFYINGLLDAPPFLCNTQCSLLSWFTIIFPSSWSCTTIARRILCGRNYTIGRL